MAIRVFIAAGLLEEYDADYNVTDTFVDKTNAALEKLDDQDIEIQGVNTYQVEGHTTRGAAYQVTTIVYKTRDDHPTREEYENVKDELIAVQDELRRIREKEETDDSKINDFLTGLSTEEVQEAKDLLGEIIGEGTYNVYEVPEYAPHTYRKEGIDYEDDIPF